MNRSVFYFLLIVLVIPRGLSAQQEYLFDLRKEKTKTILTKTDFRNDNSALLNDRKDMSAEELRLTIKDLLKNSIDELDPFQKGVIEGKYEIQSFKVAIVLSTDEIIIANFDDLFLTSRFKLIQVTELNIGSSLLDVDNKSRKIIGLFLGDLILDRTMANKSQLKRTGVGNIEITKNDLILIPNSRFNRNEITSADQKGKDSSSFRVYQIDKSIFFSPYGGSNEFENVVFNKSTTIASRSYVACSCYSYNWYSFGKAVYLWILHSQKFPEIDFVFNPCGNNAEADFDKYDHPVIRIGSDHLCGKTVRYTSIILAHEIGHFYAEGATDTTLACEDESDYWSMNKGISFIWDNTFSYAELNEAIDDLNIGPSSSSSFACEHARESCRKLIMKAGLDNSILPNCRY